MIQKQNLISIIKFLSNNLATTFTNSNNFLNTLAKIICLIFNSLITNVFSLTKQVDILF